MNIYSSFTPHPLEPVPPLPHADKIHVPRPSHRPVRAVLRAAHVVAVRRFDSNVLSEGQYVEGDGSDEAEAAMAADMAAHCVSPVIELIWTIAIEHPDSI